MGDEASEPNSTLLSTLWQSYKLPIILGSMSVLLIVISLVIVAKSYQINEPILFSAASQDSEATSSAAHTVTVDIEGAVLSPGLYTLLPGSRVGDAIIAAGGVSTDADIDKIAQTINRASKLIDGAKLFIPSKGEPGLVAGQQTSNALTNPSAQASISVNSASAAELDSLVGVGPVTAQKIIDNRPYQTLEELVTKKALSSSLFDKLKDQLSL